MAGADDGGWALNPIVDAGELERGTAVATTDVWHVIPSDRGPGPRMGAGAVVAGAHLVLVGGADMETGPFGDVHVMHLGTLAWSALACKGDHPPARYECGAAAMPDARGVVVFGGASHDRNFNDTHVLDLATATWSRKKTTGTPPSPRTLHHAAVVGDRLFVFGGGDKGNTPTTDGAVHALSLTTWEWVTHKPEGASPPARQGHTVEAVGDQLYLFGGMGSGAEFYHDVWVLDTAAMRWACADVAGDARPSPRCAHAAAVVGDTMFVAGGLGVPAAGGAAPTPLDDVYALDTKTMTWRSVESKTAPFTARLGHCMVAAPLRKRKSPAAAGGAVAAEESGKGDAASESEGGPGASDAAKGGGAAAEGHAGPRIEDVTPGFADGSPSKRTAEGVAHDDDSFELATCGGQPARGLLLHGGLDGQAFFDDTLFLRPSDV